MTGHHPPPRDTLDAPESTPQGDGALTFAAVFMRYQREIQAFLRGMLGARELAQDLTQDAFHDAWRATQHGSPPFQCLAESGGLSPAPTQIRSRVASDAVGRQQGKDAEGGEEPQLDIKRWLFHAAYLKAISVRRRWRLIRWESLDVSEETHDFSDPQAGSFDERLMENDTLRAALARLTSQDRACLMLRIVLGFSASEVGAIVGASAEVVTKRLSRARRRLRDAYLALDTEDTPSAGQAQSPREEQATHAK